MYLFRYFSALFLPGVVIFLWADAVGVRQSQRGREQQVTVPTQKAPARFN